MDRKEPPIEISIPSYLIYISIAVILLIFIIILTLLKKSRHEEPLPFEDEEEVAARPARADRAGGVRRRVPRRRMTAAQGPVDDEESGEGEIEDKFIDPIDGEGKKIGAKKLRKLQEKEEKKEQRRVVEEERRDRQRREALLEEQRKKDDEQRRIEEAAREEELKAIREEQERKEHEEYLKLKETFSIDDEGTHEAELNQDTASLLQEFINYIKDMKVVMLEDLAAHFKIKTQDAIDRINTLIGEDRLSGVMDDRGKFIYITTEEYEAVSKFIKQRGRVSITELAVSSNRLINLNPENIEVHRKLVGEVS